MAQSKNLNLDRLTPEQRQRLQEYAQQGLELRQQRREMLALLNGVLDSWCQTHGVTREELAAQAALLEDDDNGL